MKTSRKDLDRQTAIPTSYDSFFSFPASKGGYSGVGVYIDTRSGAVVHKAEEGLTGLLQPKPPLTQEERISNLSYPTMDEVTDMLNAIDASVLDPSSTDDTPISPPELKDLDAEGRALVLDFGLFVLINTYCPNDASDARMVYKMHYHSLLQLYVQRLISEGREVIVLGDINVVADLIDHAEWAHKAKRRGLGVELSNLEGEEVPFLSGCPHRTWVRKWLAGGGGPMHDVIREAWPDRRAMYTCK